MRNPPKMSDGLALRLMKANIDDPKGKDPKVVKGFDWDKFGDLQQQLEAPPEGSITAAQFAEKFKLSVHHSADILKRKVSGGEMQSKLYKMQRGAAIRYYWWKE